MANERPVRVNFAVGTLSSLMSNVTTTMNSTALGTLIPAIGTTDYVRIVLDPAATAGAPEIIHLTAHTGAATSATVRRGQEGTANRSHASGIIWKVAPTATGEWTDNNPDQLWSGTGAVAGSVDQEFTAIAVPTSLPSGWSWVNQGTSTYREEWSRGIITPQAGTTDNWRCIVRDGLGVTSAGAFFKINSVGPAGYRVGAVLQDSVSGELVTFDIDDAGLMSVEFWDNPTTTNTVINTTTITSPGPIEYFRIDRPATNTYNFLISSDGVSYYQVHSVTNMNTMLTTANIKVGFGINATHNTVQPVSCDWYRARPV